MGTSTNQIIETGSITATAILGAEKILRGKKARIKNESLPAGSAVKSKLNSKTKSDGIAFAPATPWWTEEVQLSATAPYSGISPFWEPTASKLPSGFWKNGVLQIFEGHNLVEEAQVHNATSIQCQIFELDVANLTDAEIASFVRNTRTKNANGRIRFPEDIRFCQEIRRHYLAQGLVDDVAHGGARNTSSRRPSIATVLAEKLGLTYETVLDYLAFGSYISDSAFQVLISGNASQAFLKSFRKGKSNLVKRLTDEGRTPEELVENVSEYVLEKFRVWCRKPAKKTTSSKSTQRNAGQNSNANAGNGANSGVTSHDDPADSQHQEGETATPEPESTIDGEKNYMMAPLRDWLIRMSKVSQSSVLALCDKHMSTIADIVDEFRTLTDDSSEDDSEESPEDWN